MTDLNWADGEPNQNNEKCVQTFGNANWNDITCDAALPTLCQKGMGLLFRYYKKSINENPKDW